MLCFKYIYCVYIYVPYIYIYICSHIREILFPEEKWREGLGGTHWF